MSMSETNYGGGFGNALYDILLQKRGEARQAMLDEVNRKNIESQMAAREDQAATNKMYREAEAENMKSQAADRLRKQYHMGQAVSQAGADQFKKLGVEDLLNPPAGPPAAADNQGVPPALAKVGDYDSPTYKGSPEEQDQAEDVKAVEALLNSPDGKALSPEDRMTLRYSVTRGLKGAIPAGFFNKPKASTIAEEAILLPNNHYMFQGKEVTSIPAGTQVHITRGFEPQTGGAGGVGTWQTVNINDPKDPTKQISVEHNSKTGQYRLPVLPPELQPKGQRVPAPNTPPEPRPANETAFDTSGAGDVSLKSSGPEDPRLTVEQPPPGVQIFSRGTAPKPAQSKGITSADINAIRVARAAAFKGPGGSTLKTPNPEAMKALRSAQMAIVDKLPEDWMKSDLTVVEPAIGMTLLDAAEKGMITVDEIIKNEEQPNGEVLTPEQEAHLRRVLNYALGRN